MPHSDGSETATWPCECGELTAGGAPCEECRDEVVDRRGELLDACMFCKAPTDRLFWAGTRSLSLDESFPVCLPHWNEVIKPAEHVLDVTRVMEVV